MREWLAHFEHDDPPKGAQIERTFRVMSFFRRLLTSYTIVCNGIMALQAARKLPIPEIGTSLFPLV